MKKLLAVMFISLLALLASCPAHALERRGDKVHMTVPEVEEYAGSVFNAFLMKNQGTFANKEDVAMRVTCHMASAMQILRNNGAIYAYDVLLLKYEGETINFLVRVRTEVDGDILVMPFYIDKIKADAPKRDITGGIRG